MEEIIEHFGSGFLAILSIVIFFGVFVVMLKSGGILFQLVENFMSSICG